jgi:hypothetical protein
MAAAATAAFGRIKALTNNACGALRSSPNIAIDGGTVVL